MPARRATGKSLLTCLIAACLLAACGGGGVTDGTGPGTKPDTTTTPPPGPGTVQRGTVSVQVSIDPGDGTIASLAGVSAAGIPVTLKRQGGTEAPRTAVTDASGTARFAELLEGLYEASVTRTLSPTELAKLPVADRDASVFAGGVTNYLNPGATLSLSFPLVAARRGGLVISEVFAHNGPPVAYGFGDYVEIYNNGDTTAYLDGMLLAYSGVGGWHLDNPSPRDCATYAPIREAADRFAVVMVWGFPAGADGRSFPVPPGEARVMAMDAINHPIASGQPQYPNLLGAQFEQFFSDADTDNPAAANMVKRLGPTVGALGRGVTNNNNRSIALVLPTPDAEWLTVETAGGTARFSALPASRVIDVFSYATEPTFREQFAFARPCPLWIAPVFDRGVAEIHLFTRADGIRRRSLGTGTNGREVLQRTRNSARDLEYATPLKRSLNR